MSRPSPLEQGDGMKRQIKRDFFHRRLSAVGLARKYGMTVRQVEAVIRKYVRAA